ncbi:MAG: methyltransferase domain-containing protein [Pseudomonadales bacterium]|nr:class I SAM-dependent methyltransferase [Pseudomonadales bacterium]
MRPLIVVAAVLLLGATAGTEASPARSAADLERDRSSQPFAVLDFIGLEPGMRALDVFAGDGYYSEVMAGIVGRDGHVYLHNSLGSARSLARMQQRLAAGRLPNVEPLVQDLDQLLIPGSSLDLVLLVKVFHDFYYANHGWRIAPDPALKTLYRLLKPGGIFGIVDHVARAGTGPAAAQVLHRVDPVFVCTEMQRLGFRFEGASQLLSNPRDPLDIPVFQAEVRGNTARFVHRYRKPAADELPTESKDCGRLAGS